MAGIPKLKRASCSHRGDDNEQMRDVRDAVHQIGRDAVEVLIGEIARGKDVHGEHRLQPNKPFHKHLPIQINIQM